MFEYSVLLHLKIVSSKLYLNLKKVFGKKLISQYILKHTFIQIKIGVFKLCDKQKHQKLEFIFVKHQKLYVIDNIFYYRPIINKCCISSHFQLQLLEFDVHNNHSYTCKQRIPVIR